MTNTIIKLSKCHKCIIPLMHMVKTLDNHVCDKRQIAINLFNNNPISNKMHMTKERYIMTKERYIKIYCMIARIKQFGKIYEYINKNYLNIFSFNKSIINLLHIINKKKDEYITTSNDFKNKNIKKLSKLQKRIMRITLTQINVKNPNMCKEIGNILNRLFIKDIALYICEYI
jgi:hypothetical protein